MRNTRQKELVLDIVNNSCEHLTAYQVYDISRKTIDNISLGTVYRILKELSENDKIIKISDKKINMDRYDNKKYFTKNELENLKKENKEYSNIKIEMKEKEKVCPRTFERA